MTQIVTVQKVSALIRAAGMPTAKYGGPSSVKGLRLQVRDGYEVRKFANGVRVEWASISRRSDDFVAEKLKMVFDLLASNGIESRQTTTYGAANRIEID